MNLNLASSGRTPTKSVTPLTDAQIDDLYYFVCSHGKETDNDNQFSLAVANTEEEIAFSESGPDFFSVFIGADRWPVAAAAPMDNLFHLLR